MRNFNKRQSHNLWWDYVCICIHTLPWMVGGLVIFGISQSKSWKGDHKWLVRSMYKSMYTTPQSQYTVPLKHGNVLYAKN